MKLCYNYVEIILCNEIIKYDVKVHRFYISLVNVSVCYRTVNITQQGIIVNSVLLVTMVTQHKEEGTIVRNVHAPSQNLQTSK